MIHFENLSLYQANKLLVKNASLSIYAGQKVGVVGRNGCGKSSLFQLILGELECDAGRLRIDGNPLIACMEQFSEDDQQSILHCVLAGDKAYCRLQQQIEQAEKQQKHDLLADLHEQMRDIDGYSAKARAGRILHGLGFTEAESKQPLNTFSGGWQMRVRLAKALMSPSDILLLDEPTNHLDFETLVWLENFLQNYQGTLLLISHDRTFLDRVCNHIIHFEQQQLKLYHGNYSEFERLRSQARQHLQAQIERQQKQRQHLQAFVDRFRAKATKAKQAQSRIKQLQKMEDLSLALEEASIQFDFLPCESKPANYIRLEAVNLGYADKTVLQNVHFELKPGDRLGLIGANGQGKSTLIKCLAGSLPVKNGVITRVKDYRVAYFAQHQVEQLDPESSPIAHLLQQNRQLSEARARTFLGRFGFSDDKAVSPVAPFSGGEKARLVLALMVDLRPNVILLDEPTNHLDMETRLALNMALQGFDGALVLVSHDRFLLDSLCSELFLVANGNVSFFDGCSEDYQQQVLKGLLSEATLPSQKPEKNNRKAEKKKQADLRKQLYPLKKQLNQQEEELERLSRELSKVEHFLAQAESYSAENAAQLKENLQKQADLSKKVALAEEQWMLLLERYEEKSKQLENKP